MSKDDDVNHGSAASSRALSRRNFLKVSVTGAAIASAGGLSACMTGPMAAGKTTKALALYQDTPNRGRRCGGCTHFREPNGCEIVAGAIIPNGWCRFHEPLPA
ncbi:MAG: twin-arginine translocation signal domain-containing protein [Mesorhizobium sp.]|nr:MAG: twin-arginine translocation signal domain-containing protein [Mesorhizobium sp.]TIM68287.1 MAG: twin-arginine translocation signal domain-containing protein [Mesorhizobium sp.]